jgi:hypothetical protein
MAFQLALGCETVGYVTQPRRCCNNIDLSTCSDCKSPESLVISGSVSSTGPGNCAAGADVVDGTYAIPTSFDSSCNEDDRPYFVNCTSPTRTYTIDWRVSWHSLGIGAFTSLPSPGSVVIPFPYATGGRYLVSILYAISTTVQETHYYYMDAETCPQGTHTLTFITTTIFDSSGGSLLLNSTAPTSMQLVFPP